MSHIIQASSIQRTFGKGPMARTALHNVDLQVDEGQFVAVIGPSGSGKSTLLAILGGLDSGYRGELMLFGRSAKTLKDRDLSTLRGKKIGFIFQAFHLLDHLSVIDNVLVPALFSPHVGAPQQARDALDRVGLADRASEPTAVLSGGQRQRVAIARAIAHRPSLLLCDEPTGNLDRATAEQIIEIFVALNREDGTTVLCATHDARIADAATHTMHLEEGRVVEQEENS